MRQLWEFHGGIHPPQNKDQSLQGPIHPAGIPGEIVLPFSQHLGAPAEPIVEAGEHVLKGQKVAEAQGFISVPVHAPTSGEVAAIEDRPIPHPSGMAAPCIVIRPDGRDEWIDHSGVADYRQLDKPALLELIRDAGIAGMGGAGFPSAVKLGARDNATIETLILNGTECEPYITADDILMQERAGEIIEGARILQHLVNPGRETLLGIEDNKPLAIEALRAAAAGSDIEIVEFPTRYPSGGEKQLIQILTGREVPSGGLPADIGVVCQNVGTCAAIYRAVQKGEPLISRITTVTGEACAEPRNYEVLLGTPIRHVLSLSGFEAIACIRLVMGGPMMGYALTSVEVPVVKTSNCILAPTPEELPPPPAPQPCIRCGMCSEVCPASLLPQQLYWFARGQEFEKLEDHNLFDCIECGACSYVCPSNIPLVQYYRASKVEIRRQQQEKVKAEHAKLRFEARQARIEREEAEKEARRKARKAAARKKAAETPEEEKLDVIQAAIERSKQKKPAQNLDPAQAAVERAREARETRAKQSPEVRLENTIASLQERAQKTERKLAEARETGADTVGVLENALTGLREKLNKAEAELAELRSEGASIPSHDATAAPDDPARAASAGLSEEDRLRQSIESLEKRIARAREKLAAARDSGDDNAEILAASVAKLEDRLAGARRDLADRQS